MKVKSDPAFAPARSISTANMEVPDRLFLLSLGTNVFVGEGSEGVSPGFRVGAFLGGRVSDGITANAELAIDYVNLDTPSEVSATEFMFDLTFSPLLHAGSAGEAQLVLGPRFGLFYITASASRAGSSASESGWGLVLGANAGLLVPAGQARLGILGSFGARDPMSLCLSGTGFAKQCTSDNLRTAKVLGLSFLALL